MTTPTTPSPARLILALLIILIYLGGIFLPIYFFDGSNVTMSIFILLAVVYGLSKAVVWIIQKLLK